MKENGYYISITPEVVYKEKIQQIVQHFPKEQLMVESDGPWPFEGPYIGISTTPVMMMESIRTIAKIKKLSLNEVSEKLFQNTLLFYNINSL